MRPGIHELSSAVVVVIAVILTFSATPAEGGECCRAHTTYHTYHSQRWCPVFCCGQAPTGFYCCTDLTLRANKAYIDHFCAAWFVNAANTWVWIVIGLFILAIIIASIVCCVKCCCFVI